MVEHVHVQQSKKVAVKTLHLKKQTITLDAYLDTRLIEWIGDWTSVKIYCQ
jgi:hypothetical protein